MTYNYIFSDAINTESVTAFAQWLNNVPEDALLNVYLGSSGGGVDSAEVLLDLLKVPGDRLLLQGFGSLCSATLFVFISYPFKKTLRFGTVGMAHLIYEELETLHNGQPRNERAKTALAEFPAWQKRYDEVILPHLEPAQIERYKTGEDVWLPFSQLWEITVKTRLSE